MSEIYTFQRFIPDTVLGTHVEVFSADLLSRWSSIFSSAGQEDTAGAAGLAVILMMRAYLAVVSPRPPGNIHARQKFSLQALPRPNERLVTEIRCAGKEMRGERRYIELVATGTGDDGRAIYRGHLSLIWAA